MDAGSRVLATVLAVIAWIFTGLAIETGPLAAKTLAPAVVGAAAQCALGARH
jgi:hypothetical protein